MKAPVFTPAVAALTLATVLFSSGTTYSNTRSNAAAPPNAAIHLAASSQSTVAAAVDDQPGYRRYPLIILKTPGLYISIGDNGRRCYRNPAGYYYWEGRDGRFYLDERYIRYVDYDRRSYRDWDCRDRHHYKKYKKHGRGHGHGNGHGHGRGHGRGHDRNWDDD